MQQPAVKRRKKTCRVCGQTKWLREFYPSTHSHDRRYYCCIECAKKKNRERYLATKKIPDGLYLDISTGRVMEHKGASRRIFWNANMISILKRYFPVTRNEEMPDLFCPRISVRTIIRKARQLGLEKDPQWLRGVWDENRFIAQSVARKDGNPGWLKPGHKFLGNQYTGKTNQ